MPQIGIRITSELHRQIQGSADEQGKPISDFVRYAVEHLLNGCQAPSNNGKQDELVEHLQKQVDQKDTQIQELHQLLGMAHSSVERLSQRLEDHRQSPRWWRFWARAGA